MAHRTRTAAAAAVLLLALGLSACGGSEEPDAASGTSSEPAASSDASSPSSSPAASSPSAPAPESEAVTVTASDFAFSVDEDSFAAGEVEFTLVNDGSSTHDLVVERDGEDVAAASAVDPGQTSTVTVTLEPGSYVLYCSIADHRAMGMETTVEVS